MICFLGRAFAIEDRGHRALPHDDDAIAEAEDFRQLGRDHHARWRRGSAVSSASRS